MHVDRPGEGWVVRRSVVVKCPNEIELKFGFLFAVFCCVLKTFRKLN